jgi:hypothetical protein
MKSARCRGASRRLVDQPWRLTSNRIWQWALWVLIGESWYYSPLGVLAPKADPADADGYSRVSAPNVAVGGVVEVASIAAAGPQGTADTSADGGAGLDTATDDDDDYGDDDAAADPYFFAADEPLSVEAVHRAPLRRRAGREGAGKEIVDHLYHPGSGVDYWNHMRRHAKTSLPKAAHVRAAHVAHAPSPPSGPPTSYTYYSGGAATYIQNPAGPYIPPGPALNPNVAPAGYYRKVGATAYIEDPAGTYSPAGATAPIADPGGTYSAAGASAPTRDPPGTYSSPYALTRLFLDPNPTTPATGVLSFNSATAVADYYGATSFEAGLAAQFFNGYGDAPATMLFTRYSAGGGRPHLYGGNLYNNLTRQELQSINGSLSITFQSLTPPIQQYTYSVGSIDLSGLKFAEAARTIQSDLNIDINSKPVAETSGSSIAPVQVQFTGSISGDDLLLITSVPPGSIELGAEISGPGIPAGAQIVTQRTGTSGGPGLYTLFAKERPVPSETMTESHGVLTVGSVVKGTVAVGERVTGAGVQSDNPMTAIDGRGQQPGTWIVNNAPAQRVTGDFTMTGTPLVVNYKSLGGATAKRNFFEIQPNGAFGYDNNPSTLGFASGTAAAALGLTQGSFALDSSPGGAAQSAQVFMNNLVQNEYSQFGSFQATWETLAELDPHYLGDLADWAQSTGYLYTFLSQSPLTDTPPAGSSLPTTDPAGTYSGPGASAPTIDPANTYSGPGATAPTPDPPGTWSLPGASAPTPDAPGTYINQTDTPFSAVDANFASGLRLLSPSAATAALKIGVTAPIDRIGSGLYGDFALQAATEAPSERLLLDYSHYLQYAHERSDIT